MRNKLLIQPRVKPQVSLRLRLVKYVIGLALLIFIIASIAFVYMNVGVQQASFALEIDQQILYLEDFNSYPNGTVESSKWSIDVNNANPNRFRVEKGVFEARQVRGEAVWSSSLIPIAGFQNIDISVFLPKADKMISEDYIRIYYQLDGGEEILFETNGELMGNYNHSYAVQSGLSGFHLRIIIKVSNEGSGSTHSWDDVLVVSNNYLYLEDFTFYLDKTTTSSKWTISLARSPKKFEVDKGLFVVEHTRDEAVWQTSVISISGFSNVVLSVDLNGSGSTESGDYIKVFYKLDNQPETLFPENGNMDVDFNSVKATHSGITGDSLQIIIRVKNGSKRKYSFDNIIVQGNTDEPPMIAWQGNADTDWSNPLNWNDGVLPDCNTDVLIPPGTIHIPWVNDESHCRNLVIVKNAKLKIRNGKRLIICGDFINNGSFQFENGTVELKGNSRQYLGGVSPIVVHDLVIENSSTGGVMMSNKVIVENELKLLQGKIHTNDDTLFIQNSDAGALKGFNAQSYVVGNLARRVNNTGEHVYAFPLGNNGFNQNFFTEITTHDLSATSWITCSFHSLERYEPMLYQVYDDNLYYTFISEEGMWVIQPDVQPAGGVYHLKLDIQNFSGLEDNRFGILKRPEGSGHEDWTAAFGKMHPPGGEGRTLEGGYALKYDLTSFSEFAIGGDRGTVLPIVLDYFNARLIETNTVLLEWATHTQVNNDFFSLEKSSDGIHFTEFYRVKGKGNSSEHEAYKHLDEQPIPGISYYRLKQTDDDGSHEYFKMIAVQTPESSIIEFFEVQVFPNPFNDELHIKFTGTEKGTIQVTLLDMSGKMYQSRMFEYFSNQDFVIRELSHLSRGVYLLLCQTENGSKQTVKVIKN